MFEDFRLKVFLTVVREGNFTKAALSLGVSQPAVSQNIAELEKLTGTRLFDRLPGEVRLTDSGRVFLSYAQDIDSSYRTVSDLFAGNRPLFDSVLEVAVGDELAVYAATSAAASILASSPSRRIRITTDGGEGAVVIRSEQENLSMHEESLGDVKFSEPVPSVFFTSKRNYAKFAVSGKSFSIIDSRAPLVAWEQYLPAISREILPYLLMTSTSSVSIAEVTDAASAVGVLPLPLANQIMTDGRFIILSTDTPLAFSRIKAVTDASANDDESARIFMNLLFR
ncbi:MAG: LysR family transcriptional regulator [Candidatus Cryptobacteroides sp.]